MRALFCVVGAIVWCIASAGSAQAQDAWPTLPTKPMTVVDEPPPDPGRPLPVMPEPLPIVTAADVAHAPRPNNASGVTVAKQANGAAALLIVPRVLLFVPRWALEVAVAPIRGAAWALQRYQITERTKNIFFNDDGTFGIFPVFFVETGFGTNAGLRLVDSDTFGSDEKLALRMSYGGRFRQIYTAALDSGSRLGRLKLDLNVNYAIQPKDQFFGIGNGDEIDDYDPTMTALVDPTQSTTAVNTRYRELGTRAAGAAEVILGGGFHARASGGILFRDFENLKPDDDELGERLPIEDVYDTTNLVGFSSGLTTGYAELELRYDSRRNRSRYVSQAVPAQGWLLAGYAGYATGLADSDPTSYWRLGVDLQRNINLYDYSRILILRLYTEAVVGDDDKIPFTDLARLGGRTLLRGFAIDRFRDKASTLASAEYQWDLSSSLSAFIFSDVGRVWRALDDFEFSNFRVGYGGGLQFHSMNSFLARVDVSSSLDGGLFLNISFDPVYDSRARMERD